MTKTETRVLYYNIRQLVDLGGNASIKLFSDRDRQNVVGQALYQDLTYTNKFTNESWAQELATFFFENENDCINFMINSKTTDGVLPPGDFTYTIMSGQGKYLGATGTVNFKVTQGGLRTITITAQLA